MFLGYTFILFLILYFNKYRNKKVYFLYVYDVNVNKYVFGKKNLLSTNIGQKNSNQLRVSNDECTDSA